MTIQKGEAREGPERRHDVRVDVVLRVELHFGAKPGAQGTGLEAYTKNISAGGAMLVIPGVHTLRSHDFFVNMDLSGVGPVSLLGKQIHAATASGDDSLLYTMVAVSWVDLPESKRSEIVRFIFSEQIRRRWAGLE